MSAGRRREVEALMPAEGQEIPGGCDSCDAYQTVRHVEPGVWGVRVHHDADCPVYRQIEARRRGR